MLLLREMYLKNVPKNVLNDYKCFSKVYFSFYWGCTQFWFILKAIATKLGLHSILINIESNSH